MIKIHKSIVTCGSRSFIYYCRYFTIFDNIFYNWPKFGQKDSRYIIITQWKIMPDMLKDYLVHNYLKPYLNWRITTFQYFLFQWFYFEFQQLFSQCHETKDLNIKPVTVKEYGRGIHTLFVRDFDAMGSSSFMHSFLYIRLSEPGAAYDRDNSYQRSP